jgi:hypothetical protein
MSMPRLRTGAYLSVYILYYTFYIHIKLPLEPLHLLKKPHQNLFGNFKDVSIHTMLRFTDQRVILK